MKKIDKKLILAVLVAGLLGKACFAGEDTTMMGVPVGDYDDVETVVGGEIVGSYAETVVTEWGIPVDDNGLPVPPRVNIPVGHIPRFEPNPRRVAKRGAAPRRAVRRNVQRPEQRPQVADRQNNHPRVRQWLPDQGQANRRPGIRGDVPGAARWLATRTARRIVAKRAAEHDGRYDNRAPYGRPEWRH